MKKIGVLILALIINLVIFGVLSVLNWQKTVQMPPSLKATEVIRYQLDKDKIEQMPEPEKIRTRRPEAIKRPMRLPRRSMDKFLRNVKLDAGRGLVRSPDIFLPQSDELSSILRVESGDMFEFDRSAVDVPPEPVFFNAPEYPRLARLRNIEGFVEVEFVVTTDGRVEDISITKSAPEGVFNKAVIKALRLAKFKPAQYQGKRVYCRCTQRFTFKLTDETR